MTEFGFTNDKAQYDKVVAYRDAMIADGWVTEPTYPGHEDMDKACKLKKDEFTAMILTRTKTGKWKYEAIIHIWGPDGFVIIPPEPYSMKSMLVRMRHCNSCGKDDVDAYRYSFAGRCCKECLPEMKRIHEYPGWYN